MKLKDRGGIHPAFDGSALETELFKGKLFKSEAFLVLIILTSHRLRFTCYKEHKAF